MRWSHGWRGIPAVKIENPLVGDRAGLIVSVFHVIGRGELDTHRRASAVIKDSTLNEPRIGVDKARGHIAAARGGTVEKTRLKDAFHPRAIDVRSPPFHHELSPLRVLFVCFCFYFVFVFVFVFVYILCTDFLLPDVAARVIEIGPIHRCKACVDSLRQSRRYVRRLRGQDRVGLPLQQEIAIVMNYDFPIRERAKSVFIDDSQRGACVDDSRKGIGPR